MSRSTQWIVVGKIWTATLLVLVCVCYITYVDGLKSESMTGQEKGKLKEKVLEMFDHAYGAYKTYAHPADELMPLSCKGRYRGSEVSRGDIDEALGNFSLTLIDTLDTLAVLGKIDEFDEQVRYVVANVNFNSDAVVSVFETNIRVLGGLLGAHCAAVALKETGKGVLWYNDELLAKALDVGDRLLAAFNTSTGIPYPKVNLRYGIHNEKSRVGHETDTCTACAGTMIMEFAALSRLTGKGIYEAKAHKAMEALWRHRSRHSDLVGTTINIHNGNWIRRDSGIGAGIDSYYEYCLKAYILLGDESYLEKFNRHYAAIERYIKQGYMFLDVLMHQPERPVRAVMDALQAFWPGLQVLKGDLKPAIETHELLYTVAKRHKFLPEAFNANLDVHWAQHPLRPEFAESTYFLFQATKDPHYLNVGKHIIETLENHARVPCGFAAVKDVRTLIHEDKMDSFFLAETFKYLYLLFSEEQEHTLNIHDFLFTTEAHILPLYLSNIQSTKDVNMTDELAVPIDHASKELPSSCSNKGSSASDMRSFAEMIRSQVKTPKSGASPMCATQTKGKQESSQPETIQAEVKVPQLDPSRKRKLLPSQFQFTNKAHESTLKELGISIVKGADGKIQLVHQAALAATAEDSQEGIIFMQEMLQLAKQRGDESEIKPRIVQILHPNTLPAVYNAGAAQFGVDLSKSDIGITAEVVKAEPFQSCDGSFENGELMKNRIVLMQRGGCMFIDKVRHAQTNGALGVIIMDHTEGTSSATQPTFAMSGDNNTEDVKIPAVFLFHKEGMELLGTMSQIWNERKQYVDVRLGSKPQQWPAFDRRGKRKLVEFQKALSKANAQKKGITGDTSSNDGEFPDYSKLTQIDSRQEVNIDHSGGKVTRTVSTYIGPNMQGRIVKHICTTTETCPTVECGDGSLIHIANHEEEISDEDLKSAKTLPILSSDKSDLPESYDSSENHEDTIDTQANSDEDKSDDNNKTTISTPNSIAGFIRLNPGKKGFTLLDEKIADVHGKIDVDKRMEELDSSVSSNLREKMEYVSEAKQHDENDPKSEGFEAENELDSSSSSKDISEDSNKHVESDLLKETTTTETNQMDNEESQENNDDDSRIIHSRTSDGKDEL